MAASSSREGLVEPACLSPTLPVEIPFPASEAQCWHAEVSSAPAFLQRVPDAGAFLALCGRAQGFAGLLQSRRSDPAVHLFLPPSHVLLDAPRNCCLLLTPPLSSPSLPLDGLLPTHTPSKLLWSVPTRLRLCGALSSAIRFLHAHDLPHGSLSSSVVSLDASKPLPPLQIFGLPSISALTPTLTPASSSSASSSYHRLFLAPELTTTAAATPTTPEATVAAAKAADMFATGVLLHELLVCRRAHFAPLTDATSHRAALAACQATAQQCGVAAAVMDMAARCLALEPAHRPSAQQLWEFFGGLVASATISDDSLAQGFWASSFGPMPAVQWSCFARRLLRTALMPASEVAHCYACLLAACLSIKVGDHVSTRDIQQALLFSTVFPTGIAESSETLPSAAELIDGVIDECLVERHGASGCAVFKPAFQTVAGDFLMDIVLFNDVLQWFGPFNTTTFLPGFVSCLSRNWFHGNISGGHAVGLLRDQPPGTYLFRFSATDPGSYAATVHSRSGEFMHYRIYHKPSLKYLFGKVECQSLEEVLYRYKRDLHLQTPLRPTPYEFLFAVSAPARASGFTNRYTAFTADDEGFSDDNEDAAAGGGGEDDDDNDNVVAAM